ncbi:MAG: STAS domain-containing protein [Algicola sp.]|nr:STAS domain-containing protein [Algicola sp.]
MSVSFQTDQQLQEITIRVSGHFDFRLVTEFRKAYNAIQSPKKVIVDLQDTDYIDSSGLGILIYLRKHFDCKKENIHLINCNSIVTKTFIIARFNKMFVIK